MIDCYHTAIFLSSSWPGIVAVPAAVPVIPFHLKFTQGEGENKESVLDYEFTTHDLVSAFRSVYLFKALSASST